MIRLPFTISSEKQDLSHISHNAPNKYPTMHHFVTEMCTCVHISFTNWCIVGYGTVASWDLIQYIEITYLQYHFISNTEHKYIILQKFNCTRNCNLSNILCGEWQHLCKMKYPVSAKYIKCTLLHNPGANLSGLFFIFSLKSSLCSFSNWYIEPDY